MNNNQLLDYIHGRRCAILGLGVSNLPLARLLCEAGIALTVHDKKSVAELGEDARALEARGVRFVTGADAFDAIDAELIFRSPGIRPDLEGIARAVAGGATLTGEIELFLQLADVPTFAVTGSDGKTTSTTLTGKFLAAEHERVGIGKVAVGGNIGAPLLDRLDTLSENDVAVMELSSFQLMTLSCTPRFVAITNVTPNHLDWHMGMDEYVAAKRHIVGEQTERLVTNFESPITRALADELMQTRKNDSPALYLFSSKATSHAEIFPNGSGKNDRAIFERDGVIWISDGVREEALLAVKTIRVPGRHNVENYMTAIGLTYGIVALQIYTEVAESFRGVEHRLEWVRRLNCVDYYNSSIDSSPTRTAAALSALNGRDIVAICGGYDKKIPFAPLADALCAAVRAVVLTGATAEKIATALDECDAKVKPTVVRADSFEDAVLAARSLAREGGCVLLSPACASFDAFKNFAERGERFREIVNSLGEE